MRLTGQIPLDDQEFGTVKEGFALNSAITVLAVIFILWMALKSGRLIIAVAVSTLVGLLLTAAAGLAAVGALNLISIAFAVLFIGIGVDFGIQFSVRYRDERYSEPKLITAVTAAGARAGRPLLLAAAATAAGFYSFLPTDYKGISELGLIAGNGMIFAFLVSITLLPALLTIFHPPSETREVGYRFLAPLDEFLTRHRWWVIGITVGLAVVGSPLLRQVKFDFNPLEPQQHQGGVGRDPARPDEGPRHHAQQDRCSRAVARPGPGGRGQARQSAGSRQRPDPRTLSSRPARTPSCPSFRMRPTCSARR